MIAINFASRDYRLISRISAGLVAMNILLLAVTAVMLWTARSYRADVVVMDQKLKGLKDAEEQMKPVLSERDQIVKELTAMSGLMEARRFSWTRLLTSIEAVVPAGVALDRMEYDRKDDSLALEGKARSPESLRNLIVGLEKSASFKDPLLKHQSLDKGNISFNVVALYQEHTTTVVAERK
jgi:Tfp pilus assembly protein PilN